MLPNFLLPETVVRQDGTSTDFALDAESGKQLQLTLGITRIIEQESLDIAIWGSTDRENWGIAPLISFPQKFYCGTYSLPLDLTEHPEVKYLRVEWKMLRWGRGEPTPLFGFYVMAERASSAAAMA